MAHSSHWPAAPSLFYYRENSRGQGNSVAEYSEVFTVALAKVQFNWQLKGQEYR